VRVHLDESKTTIGLEAGFCDITKILEQGDKVCLRSVGREIANIASSLPLGSLLDNHIKTLYAMGGKMVMPEGSGRCHAHRCHGLLLGNGRLTLLVGPVAADGARPQPFAVHRTERTFGVGTVAESDEAVAAGSACFHIPHDARFRHNTEGRECLKKDFIIDLVGEIADEDVKVIRCIFLGRGIGLISPINADFLREVSASSQALIENVRLRCCARGGR
jgi:hypothetical protein